MWHDIKSYGSYRKKNPRYDNIKSFIEKNGFNKCLPTSKQDFVRFFTTGRDTFGTKGDENQTILPYSDHELAFKNTKTNTICFVSMPYGDFQGINVMVQRTAKMLGLEAEVYTKEKSWYLYSDANLLIVWHLPGVIIEV